MADPRIEKLTSFVQWAQAHITGDEKGQAQVFAAAGLRMSRDLGDTLPKRKGGLHYLYRTLELPGTNSLKDAHASLDAAVLAAYSFNPKADLLAQLLDLNQQVAARIENGEPVTAPGLPLPPEKRAAFIAEDCIRPPKI